MGRPRIFESDAIKQRTYRLRRKIRETDAEKLHYARLEQLHRVVRRAASEGHQDAKNMLGRNASDTALKIIMATQPEPDEEIEAYTPWNLFGFDIGYYAFEEAASSVLLEKSEMKDGVFQVVIGTEKRAPRKSPENRRKPHRTGSKL
jgi:hypothetical protein